MGFDFLDLGFRKNKIKEIKGEENKRRKEESLRRFEIYRERQRPYILERLKQEFSIKTVKQMRTFTSISLCKKIVDEISSIYKNSPTRNFQNVNDAELEQLEKIYDQCDVNIKMKLANRYHSLENQCAIYVVPKDGKLDIRILLPHHYDVVVDPNDPLKPIGYIINILDRTSFNSNYNGLTDISASPTGATSPMYNDTINQDIADEDDWKASLERYVFWTKDLNFICDGKGRIVNEDGVIITDLQPEDVVSPIPGTLPFIDIASERDFEFWVRYGNSIVDFSIDFGVLLSDVANLQRLQGYAQAVIASKELPKDLEVGPHTVIHLPIDGDGEGPVPTFDFVNPSTDLNASLDLLETYLRLFLSSQGIDPKTVSGKADTNRFSSGIERLLSMIEKFSASSDSIDLFRSVEDKLLKIIITWNNALNGTGIFDEEFQGTMINENAFLQIQYARPDMVQTQSEKEDSLIKLMKEGLKSRVEAIMELREVDEDEAKAIIEEIDSAEADVLKKFVADNTPPPPPVPQGEDQIEDQSNIEETENTEGQ